VRPGARHRAGVGLESDAAGAEVGDDGWGPPVSDLGCSERGWATLGQKLSWAAAMSVGWELGRWFLLGCAAGGARKQGRKSKELLWTSATTGSNRNDPKMGRKDKG
jgi:hypothetical protein